MVSIVNLIMIYYLHGNCKSYQINHENQIKSDLKARISNGGNGTFLTITLI